MEGCWFGWRISARLYRRRTRLVSDAATTQGRHRKRQTDTHGSLSRPADPKTKSFEIGVQGEELTLLAESDLSAFTLANISSIQVMYAATTNEGHRLVVFTTDVDYTDDKVQAFYGTDDRMIQRKVFSIFYDHAVHLDFDLDGVRTTAELIFGFSPIWGAPRLKLATGVTLPLTPVPGSPGSSVSGGDAGDGGATQLAQPAVLVSGLRFFVSD
jgi:hypothetical protein